MGELTLSVLLDLMRDFGLLALTTYILWSGAHEQWVWGWHYKALQRERDQWRELALSSLQSTERAVQLSEHLGRKVIPCS